MICSKCGAQNIDGVTFCGSCGATMNSPVPPPIPETPQQNSWNEGGSNQQPPPYGQQQQPYGQQQTYNTSRSEIPYNGGLVMPKDYMTESIIVTVVSFLCCCCSPISIILGIIAIVKANSVKTEFERGDINAAISNSESAKKLTMWAAIVAVIYMVLLAIVYFAFVAAIIAEAGGFDAFMNNY